LGRLCLSGACKEANCRQNSECLLGLVCRKNLCSNCFIDGDCGADKLCIQAVCITGNCRQNGNCPEGKVCINYECLPMN
jgi:hypothetical protein